MQNFVTNNKNDNPFIVNEKLRGHNGDVLCVEHNSSIKHEGDDLYCTNSNRSCSVLSGSEDQTCRLWDLRTLKTSVCIRCEGEVLSVSFGPKLLKCDALTEFGGNYIVYAAVENNVYGYDLRYIKSPIVKESTITVMQSTDEVNQILFSRIEEKQSLPTKYGTSQNKKLSGCSKSKKGIGNQLPTNPVGAETSSSTTSNSSEIPPSSTYIMSSADDTGAVSFIPLRENECGLPIFDRQTEKVGIHGTDEVPAMITSIAFRPVVSSLKQQKHQTKRNNPTQKKWLASGGTDCQIKLWDAVNGENQPFQSIQVTNIDSDAKQVCNPPMIHNLSWSPSGRLLAAALGDGSVGLWQMELNATNNNVLKMTARLEDAHSSPVGCCLFPEWYKRNQDETDKNIQYVHDRLFCTAGNDMKIAFWDLGSTICGEGSRDPGSYIKLYDETIPNVQNMSINEKNDDDYLFDKPKILFALNHGKKPNWLDSSRGVDPCYPAAIFVADTSVDITIYSVPQM